MSLRKSPVRTPALLAANRANAAKCTGPRTPQGKARAALNSLKHGRHARRLPGTLAKASFREGQELYRWLVGQLYRTFEPRGREGRLLAQRMACGIWSQAWRFTHKTKPECALESAGSNPRHPSLLRIRIDDPLRRRGLVFWLQRHRYWTFDRWMTLVEDAVAGRPRHELLKPCGDPETRLRARRFRTARPGLWR